MEITALKPNIHYVGVNDRTTRRFEALWSLPYGVSYNAYLVVGEQTALIDTVEEGFGSRFFHNIQRILGDRPVDYVVINHMEPDHSSALEGLRLRYPGVRFVGNAKTLDMLRGYYAIADNTLCVKEGDTLPLGEGLSLVFRMIPMVHWPETMVTECPERRTLFTGDAFGTFGTLDGGILDSQLTLDHYWDEMRRYYACIVGKYGVPVQNALKKLSALDFDTVCPTHGPVWQQELPRVTEIYDRLSRYAGEPGIVIAYGSMYGHTEALAEEIARGFAAAGERRILLHNLSSADPSAVLRDVFRYDTLVVGSPTYNGELFPEVDNLLRMLAERNVPQRRFAYFGSFTWASAAVRRLGDFATRMKWEVACPPIELKQGDIDGCRDACRQLVDAVRESRKEA